MARGMGLSLSTNMLIRSYDNCTTAWDAGIPVNKEKLKFAIGLPGPTSKLSQPEIAQFHTLPANKRQARENELTGLRL
ncbi:MAG: hypothetical protein NCW75_09460 [Phycisphaera sp.]|nr:MAG: hypothetical protein NCW75_09460 [Phycisphaera sp.]